MKIYVVTASSKGEIICSTETTTDKNLIDAIIAKPDDECYDAVTECDSDNAELFTKKIWRVDFDKDNEIAEVHNVSDTAGYYLEIDKVNFSVFDYTYIVVTADDILSAIEIAKKKYQEVIKKLGE